MRALDRIFAGGIISVIRAPTAELATRAVEAIHMGGIDAIELTMTIPGAIALIDTLVRRFGDRLLIGAGTVLDAKTAHECVAAGAAFVVSPILDPATIAQCRKHGIPAIPGALTPTEIMAAVRAGADAVKVFPCSALGGASYIRSIKAPLPDVHLIATGGVSLKAAADFIRAGASAVGLGADLVNIAQIREGRDDTLTENARLCVEAVARERAVPRTR
jgi:2-dehydro-3-deoxyphosphogluconate aldolase/(4S)-4-hydroxy-2-oxoglutarate aldolase